MKTTTTTTTARDAEPKPRTGASAAPNDLDDLAALGADELARLYAAGSVPADLSDLVGRPKGRMLAVRATDGTPLFGALKLLAAQALFPWDGKTFGAGTPSEGTGINRVKLGPLRYDWFPFKARVEPSVVDGQPCIYLDYEQPGNPFFIAKIRDEIRELRPGLFLGPAMWKTGPHDAAHVLWFAVDFAEPSQA